MRHTLFINAKFVVCILFEKQKQLGNYKKYVLYAPDNTSSI